MTHSKIHNAVFVFEGEPIFDNKNDKELAEWIKQSTGCVFCVSFYLDNHLLNDDMEIILEDLKKGCLSDRQDSGC